MAKSDNEFALMAISMKLLTKEQAEEGLRLVVKAKGVGLVETLAEVLVKKGYLNRAQEAAVAQALNQPRVSRIGKYHLIARIGQGGMGTVYKAKQESLDKIVALKVMAPSLARQRDFVVRFIREAQASGKLNHPNVVLAIDAGEADGYYYFAMEFVDGESLMHVLEREGKVPERRALEITAAVAAGLGHAHDNGIVHRDIKPANIFLTRDGTPKLGDLGLAKEIRTDKSLTQAGIPVGTPYYISPEQARGEEDVDGRADLYALGATLYRVVAGDVPYEGATGAIVMTKHLNDPIPDARKTTPGLSDACVAIIHHCMQKRREDRYRTAKQLREDILLALAGKPLRYASRPSPRAAPLADRLAQRQAEAAAARKRMLIAGGAVGALLVAILFVVLLTSGRRGQPPQAVAQKPKATTAQPVGPKTPKKAPPKTSTPVKTVAKPDATAVLGELKAFAAESDDRAGVEKRLRDFCLDPRFAGSREAAQAKALLAELKARWKEEDDLRAAVAEHIKQQRFAEARAALDMPPLKEKSEKTKALLEDLAAQVKRAAAEHVAAENSKGEELLRQGDLLGARKLYERLAKLGLPEATEVGQGALKKLAELAAARDRRAAQSAFASVVAQAKPLLDAGKLQEARALFDPAKAEGNKALADLLAAGQGDLDRLAALFDEVTRELAERAANKQMARIRGIGRTISSVGDGVVHCTGGSFPIHQLRAVDLGDLACLKGKEVLLALLELYRGECAAATALLDQHAPKPPDAAAARWRQQIQWVEALAKEGQAAELLAEASKLADQSKWKEATDALTRLGEQCGDTAFAEKHRVEIGGLCKRVADAVAATVRKEEQPKPFIDVTEKCPDLAKAFKAHKMAGGWVVDINNDGLLDIALDIRRRPGESRLVPVFFNETQPGSKELVFTNATQQVGLDTGDEPICWADLDGDGDLDVVCRGLWGAGPRADGAKLALYENTGKGSPLFRLDPARCLVAELGQAPGQANYGFANIAVLDANCDGRPDIIGHFVGQMRTLCLFGSRPRPFVFDDVTEAAGFVVRKGRQVEAPAFLNDTAWLQYVALDYDGDDRSDVLLTGVSATLLHNGRRGFAPAAGAPVKLDTYVSPASGNSPIIIPAVADYNNDGLVDIFVPQKGKNLLLQNTGDGKFVDAMHTTGPMATHEDESLWATWADVNDDGLLDLFVCNAATRNRLYIQKSNRAFIDNAPEYGVAGEMGEKTNFAVFADLDRDGDLDMIVFRESGHSQALLNPYVEGDNRYYLSVIVRTRLGATGAKVYLLRLADQAVVGLQQVGRVEGFNRQTPFEAFFGVAAAGEYGVKAVLSNGSVIRQKVTVKPNARNVLVIGREPD
ncbi:MAG TPA: protein kinase [Planctomycetota bacterium]|nr:protein kinase [Planctomycetota bacterium]